MEYQTEREQVAYFMRRLYRQQLTTTSGGNISCRIANGDIVAITASKLDKCELLADGVGLVAMDGASLTPELNLSIETGMHLAIYRARPDVTAIVHAHPATATAFCAVKKPLDTRLTAEAYAILGKPGMPGKGFPDFYDTSRLGSHLGYVRRTEEHGLAVIDWLWILDFADQAWPPRIQDAFLSVP